MTKDNNNLIYIFLCLIFFLFNFYLKYPHINKDGLLYINDAIKFSGDYAKFFEMYGLPSYSIILYYINIFIDNYSFSSYVINLISYSILIIYISKIASNLAKCNVSDLYIPSFLVFCISKLISDYYGLTIRDYIGWTFLIISFYQIFQYINSKNSKNLLFFIISIFLSSLFRIEYILIFIPITVLFVNLNRNIKSKNFIHRNYIYFIFFVTFVFIFFTERSNEINTYFTNFYKILASHSIIFFIEPILIIVKKIFTLFLPYFVFIPLINNYKRYFLKSYFLLISIFSLTLVIINYIYFLNTGITSARYYIPILLLFMPYFSCVFLHLIKNSDYRNKIIFYFLVFVFIAININKNFNYKNTDIIDFKKYIEINHISLNDIFFLDNRLLYYFGIVDISHKKFNKSIFCESDLKYFFINKSEISIIEDFNNYKTYFDPLISNKYLFIERISSCE
jgi:hypothetical protein